MAQTKEKVSKAEANYTPDAREKDDQCKYCEHFRPPMGCTRVEGHISRNGWCILFTEKD